MEKKNLMIIAIVLLTMLSIFLVFKKDTSVVEKSKVSKIERKEFSIYKEQTLGGKDWQISTDTTFPTSGYLLNTTKTMCYDYNGKEIEYKPTQELTKGSIDGRVTIESSKTIYCELYFDLDNKVPEINTFSITGKTSSGTELNNGYTYGLDVTYKGNWLDEDVVQYCISDNSQSCSNWTEISNKDVTVTSPSLTNGDGEKTMYMYLKDKANNISVTTNKSKAKITVDQTKPVIKTFTLTGAPDTSQTLSSSTDYTHKVGITYNASITESNIESYCVYESSCSYQTTTSTSFSKVSYTLTNTEGSHSVKIKVKDKAGNESDVSTQSIKLDKTNPTAEVKENTKDISSITVTVTGTDTTPSSNIIQRQCRESGGSWVTASNSNGSCTISNLSDGTPYTIEGRVRDASGRYSQAPFPSVSVTTDYAYRCDVGTLVEDPSKGWICTTNGKTLINTYWTCSAEPTQKYSSESQAESTCKSTESGKCSVVEKGVECVGGVLIDDGKWCKTGGPGTCSFDRHEFGFDWFACSVRSGYSTNSLSYCEEICFKGYSTTKEVYACEFDEEEYKTKSSCSRSCVKTSTLGTVGRRDDESYYCESGWNELSHSGTSELVCYKDAIRG